MTTDDAIRRRAEAATPGPWKTGDRFGNRSLGSSVVVLAGNLPPVELDPHRNGRNDAAFIAHARTDVPAMLDEVGRLCAELDAIGNLAYRASGDRDALTDALHAIHTRAKAAARGEE